AEHEACCRVDRSFDAGAVIGLDALEIELDELLRADLFGPDCTLHVRNRRFLEVEPLRSGGLRNQREVHGGQHRRTDTEHGNRRAKASRMHGTASPKYELFAWYAAGISSQFAFRADLRSAAWPLCQARRAMRSVWRALPERTLSPAMYRARCKMRLLF